MKNRDEDVDARVFEQGVESRRVRIVSTIAVAVMCV
jgi:hypothetical protein